MNTRNGQVIVKPIKKSLNTVAGVESYNDTRLGVVVSVAKEVTDLQIGDEVLIANHVGRKAMIKDEEYVFLNGQNQDILCKL